MRHQEPIHGARCWHAGLMLALLTASGCSGSPLPVAPSTFGNGATSVFDFTIQASHNTLPVGSTLALQVSGKDDQGRPVSADPSQLQISWVSSSPTTASINSSGVVTGIQPGSVVITATSQNPSRVNTFSVQVLSPGQTAPTGAPAQSAATPYPTWGVPGNSQADSPINNPPLPAGLGLRVYPLQPRVTVGARLRLLAYLGTLAQQAPTSATWQTSDPTIATVDANGVVSGLKAGLVTLVAGSLSYPGLQAPISLEVTSPVQAYQLKGISLAPSHATLSVGQSLFVQATIPTWNGGHDANIRWSVSDASVLSVSASGQVTALAPGYASVTATALSYTQGTLRATIPVQILNASSSQPLANF